MKRRFNDPRRKSVWDRVLAEVNRAAEQQRDGFWVTYLIRDPRFQDKRGNPGLPIYVGQTDDFPKRVLSRFTKCEKIALQKGVDCVERRVADLLHLDVVAQYQLMDRQPTRLNSLVSETNMARLCWSRGYDLANRRTLQNQAGPPIGRHDIPEDWLLPFSLAEGIADDIVAEVTCRGCQLRVDVGLGHFAKLTNPPKTLRAICDDPMWATEPCTGCGEVAKRRVKMRAN